jgi:hypothetical protein
MKFFGKKLFIPSQKILTVVNKGKRFNKLAQPLPNT